jgi:urea transport system permease protein
MATDKSLEAVVWVAVGGRGTLVGPIIGAIFVNALKSWATRAYPDYWLIILGGMFLLVVLFLPARPRRPAPPLRLASSSAKKRPRPRLPTHPPEPAPPAANQAPAK